MKREAGDDAGSSGSSGPGNGRSRLWHTLPKNKGRTVSTTTCSQCGKDAPSATNFCIHCGEPLVPGVTRVAEQQTPTRTLPRIERRYAATRTVVVILRLVGWIAAALGLVFAIVGAEQGSALYTVLPFIGGLAVLLSCIASAEGLQVILDMEEHQRAIRLLAERAYTQRT